METLSVKGVCKRFGAVVVAEDVSFAVQSGTCLGVIGPNGAGKTTLFNSLTGAIRVDKGSILLEGQDITHMPLYKRARMGIGRAYQIPKPFDTLTVYENVLTAVTFGGRAGSNHAGQQAREIIERVGLASRINAPSGGMGLLDRKRLELAKALGSGTKVLLLDEIAGGLTEHEVHQLVDIVISLKKDYAIIWIEHIAHALKSAADRIMVLHFGRKLTEGDPEAVLDSAEVREIYLGVAVNAAS